jgi:RNA recognition motif-containing protein
MKIYVGNLAYSVNDDQLRSLFEEFGEVLSARVVMDKITGKAKGFGFVEISEDGARRAIERLNGSQFEGRTLVVNEARPREDRPMPSSRGGMPRRNNSSSRY